MGFIRLKWMARGLKVSNLKPFFPASKGSVLETESLMCAGRFGEKNSQGTYVDTYSQCTATCLHMMIHGQGDQTSL
jgi:hypothetical protein